MDLPDGVVTFLFTDIEGSIRLWEDAPDAMMDALRLHDEKIDVAVDEHQGVSAKPRGEGDSRFVVFRVPTTRLQLLRRSSASSTPSNGRRPGR